MFYRWKNRTWENTDFKAAVSPADGERCTLLTLQVGLAENILSVYDNHVVCIASCERHVI